MRTANNEVGRMQKKSVVVYFALLTLSCSINTSRGAEYASGRGQELI
jgi:hypothetical protein